MDWFDYSKFIEANMCEHSETDISKEFGGLLRDHPDLESFDLDRYDFEEDECVVCVKMKSGEHSSFSGVRYYNVLITNYLRFLLVKQYYEQYRAGPNLKFINVDDEDYRDVPIKLPIDYVDIIDTYKLENVDEFCKMIRDTFKYVCRKYNILR